MQGKKRLGFTLDADNLWAQNYPLGIELGICRRQKPSKFQRKTKKWL